VACSPIGRPSERPKNWSPVGLELAHITVEEHEALRQEITRRRAMRVSKTGSQPKRRGIPRSRTFWPGQAVVCGVCGGPMYYSGRHLRCRNSLPRYGGSCWNHVQLSAELARERACRWLADFVTRKTPCRRNRLGKGPRRQGRRRRWCRGCRALDFEAAGRAVPGRDARSTGG